MKSMLHLGADSRPQSCSSGEEETDRQRDNHHVVVKLEDDDPENEMDLSIFAPIETSEEEEDEEQYLSDSSGVSLWRRERVSEKEDCASLEKRSSKENTKARCKNQQTFMTEKRQKQSIETDFSNGDMNVGVPSENPTFYQAVPSSSSARGPGELSGLDKAISPLAAMEPPVFPNAPVQSKSVVGEDQQNVLLEVLNYCRLLHAAVQRLEEKIDRPMSNERRMSVNVEEGELPFNLSQRLGPPVQRNPRWIPPWKRGTDRADLQAKNNSLQLSKPPGGGRGKGRGRGRGRRGRKSRTEFQPQISDPTLPILKTFGEQISAASTAGPQPSQIVTEGPHGNMGAKNQQKSKKALARDDGENFKLPMMANNKEAKLQIQQENKVMIGSPLRKVWIPLSVYKEVFKELEPQKALVPVLHAVFPISTLSCSAVTGNPAKGIQQLDPNKIEAIREFLAEMYPQFDVSVRGVSWAQCLGVISNITKNLKKRVEK